MALNYTPPYETLREASAEIFKIDSSTMRDLPPTVVLISNRDAVATIIRPAENPEMRSLASAYATYPVETCLRHPVDETVRELVERDDATRELLAAVILDTEAGWRADLLLSIGRAGSAVAQKWGVGLVGQALKDPDQCVRDSALQCLELWRKEPSLALLKQHLAVEQIPLLKRYVEQLVTEMEEECQ